MLSSRLKPSRQETDLLQDCETPPASLSTSTHPCPHVPRIFLGPLPNSPSSSQRTTSSHHFGHAREGSYPSTKNYNASTADLAEESSRNPRNNAASRRQRASTNLGGDWGGAASSGSRFKTFFGMGGKRKKRERGWSGTGSSVGGRKGSAGRHRSGSVGTTWTDMMENDDEGLGWFKIKWEGDPPSIPRSRTNSDAATGRPRASSAATTIPKGTPTKSPQQQYTSSSPPRILLDRPGGLTSSPTPTLHAEASSTQSLLPHASSPGTSLLPQPNAIASSSSRLQPPPNPSRSLTNQSRPSLLSSGVDSFQTARSHFDAFTPTPTNNPSEDPFFAAETDEEMKGSAGPSSLSIPPPLNTSLTLPLPTIHHTAPSLIEEDFTEALNPIFSTTIGLPIAPSRPEKPPLRSSLRPAISEPHLPTIKKKKPAGVGVHFPEAGATFQQQLREGKGKERAVAEEIEGEEEIRGDQDPVPPEVVLSREGGPGTDGLFGIDGARDDVDEEDFGPNSVIIRGRCLLIPDPI
jgi:hypothetical protein